MKSLRLLVLLIIFICISSEILAQPKKNLEIIRDLSVKNIDSLILQDYPYLGDTLNLRFIPYAESWIVENSIIARLNERGRKYIISDTSNFNYPVLQFAISEMSVKYGNVFYDGFLGPKKVVRTVKLELSLKITNHTDIKKIDYLSQQYQDTVSLEAVNQLEDEHVQSSKGIIPDEAILDRIISPVIITSSVAVIVYLFFTLRK